MPAYSFGAGYDLELDDLSPLVPQPRTDATVQPVLRSYAASGAVHEQGGYIELLYSSLKNAAMYQSLLAQMELTNALTSAGTLYLPDHAFVWRRYNGIVARPQQGDDIKRNGYFIGSAIFRVTRLVLIP